MGTERGAVFIEGAPQTGERIVVPRVIQPDFERQGFEILMDEGQDLGIAFTSIAQHFADGESGETLQQLLETENGQQVVVAIGRCERTVSGQKVNRRSSTILKALDFSEMMFATGLRGELELPQVFTAK